MSQSYRVSVFITGFDVSRASELKEMLKIHNSNQGTNWFKDVLRRANDGERVQVYQTNSDADAMRVGGAYARAGAEVEVDGLPDEEEEF